MSRRKSNKNDQTRDYRLALASARAFYKQATPFLKSIGHDKETHVKAVNDIGGTVAAATTIALSLEIYLKALRVLEGQTVPPHHDLLNLYKGLSAATTKLIEEHYEREKASLEPAVIMSLEILLAKDHEFDPNSSLSPIEQKKPYEKLTVSDVLKSNRDAFQNWRYFYEHHESKRTILLRFDYIQLCMIVKSIERVLSTAIIKT